LQVYITACMAEWVASRERALRAVLPALAVSFPGAQAKTVPSPMQMRSDTDRLRSFPKTPIVQKWTHCSREQALLGSFLLGRLRHIAGDKRLL